MSTTAGFRRRQRAAGLATAMSLAALAAGCGSSHAAATGNQPGGPVSGGDRDAAGLSTITTAYLVQVQARVLVDGAGYVLYMFLPDRAVRVTCTGLCAKSWPPVFQPSTGRIHTGDGVEPALLGSDPDPAGGRVVTYDHWPLYAYADDPQPGFATGQGVNVDGGYWYLIRPDGDPLVPAGEPPAPSP